LPISTSVVIVYIINILVADDNLAFISSQSRHKGISAISVALWQVVTEMLMAEARRLALVN